MVEKIIELFKNHQTLSEIDLENITHLSTLSKEPIMIVQVPYLENDIHDMVGLKEMNSFLFGGRN